MTSEINQKLLSLGYSLIPIYGILENKCTCGRENCSSPGKHPITKNGVKDASNDPKIVEKWERTHQNCNFGVSAGRLSNLVVVDLDLDKEADNSLSVLSKTKRFFPETFTVKTGGGYHLYFNHPDCDISNKVSVLPGIDIRADGGYCVAPGSTHYSGSKYTIEKDVSAADLPEWCIALIKKAKAPLLINKKDGKIHEGQGRNNFLFSEGRSLRAKGWSNSLVEKTLRDLNEDACVPPIEEPEISTVINSCLNMPDTEDFSKKLAEREAEEEEDDFLFMTGTEFDKIELPEQSFIIDNLIARQTLVLFGAPPKAGKSTFLYAMIAALTKGERFLDLDVEKSKVLLIPAEESESMVRERLRQFGAINENIHVIIRNEKKPKSLQMTPKLMQRIADKVKLEGIDFVAIDTLARFVKFEDENDNMDTQNKIIPLQVLRDFCKVTVFTVHHTKKALQTDDIIDNFRGASAIAAAADSLIALKEFSQKNSDDDYEGEIETDIKDFQRKILVKSRMSGPVTKLKVQLDPYSNLYSIVGNSKTRLKNKSLDLIYLNLNGTPLTAKEISLKCRIPERTLKRHLDDLVELKQAEKIQLSKFPPKCGFVRGKIVRKLV